MVAPGGAATAFAAAACNLAKAIVGAGAHPIGVAVALGKRGGWHRRRRVSTDPAQGRAPPPARAWSGMVALPAAFLALGGLLGTALLLAVAALVYRTKAAVVDAAGAHPRAKSYAALATATCGRVAGLTTQAAVVAFCFGFLVVVGHSAPLPAVPFGQALRLQAPPVLAPRSPPRPPQAAPASAASSHRLLLNTHPPPSRPTGPRGGG
jgi:hypothetical protein